MHIHDLIDTDSFQWGGTSIQSLKWTPPANISRCHTHFWVQSPLISIYIHWFDAVEVTYVGKIILSWVILKKSSNESWRYVTSECGYSHYDNGLYVRNIDITPTQAAKKQWHCQHPFLSIMINKSVKAQGHFLSQSHFIWTKFLTYKPLS